MLKRAGITALALSAAVGYATDVCVESLLEDFIVSDFQLTCPTGQVITNITFASYGAPTGTCADNNFQSVTCALIDPSNSWQAQQQKVDSNTQWTLDTLCYGKNSCYWYGYIVQGNTTADDLFGDPCPHRIKWLSVRASCGSIVPQTVSAPSIWSTDARPNLANFHATKEVVQVMYDIVDGTTPYQTLMNNFKSLQLDFTPTPTTPFRFVPLITYEKQFSIEYSGYTTAWFGIMSKLITEDGFIVIAFRGTLTATDWIYNADIQSVTLPDSLKPNKFDGSEALVHQGFSALYTGMQGLVRAGVAAYNPKGIIITGHSLGSALATLAAYDLANQGYPVHSVYTFASPRVGNPYFVDLFSEVLGSVGGKMYRIANSADIVTQVPPAVLSVGGDGSTGKYMHVGGVDFTYEYIPKNDTVLGKSIGDFVEWAHSLDTYEKYAPTFLDFVDVATSAVV
eukprot:TRINITY_DN649_c0_g1_i1.p1 TRINITY_DN649_c0_g1~~TRINITY_DN649_c0_g1_i1.p1  ORF type:complete len:453 (-),score=121.41 TRINITY_DN649_c0_g1_i1:40-1398(-)